MIFGGYQYNVREVKYIVKYIDIHFGPKKLTDLLAVFRQLCYSVFSVAFV